MKGRPSFDLTDPRGSHDEQVKKKERADELHQAWGDWLVELDRSEGQVFDWFVTLTFRKGYVHPEVAHKAWKLFVHWLNRTQFGNRYYKRTEGVRWARALEYQRRGVIHFHALVGDVANVGRLTMMDKWWDAYGIARIYPYDPQLGAAHYLAKYIAKDGEIDLGGAWTFGPLYSRLT